MDVKLAELLSINGGRLPKYLTKDDYPVYYITKQGVILCPSCANLILLESSNLYGDTLNADDLVDYRINWDNYTLECIHGHIIDSATIELDFPKRIGVLNHDRNKRQIPNKIGHVKLQNTREQTSHNH